MRLKPVLLNQDITIQKLLEYYMGKNTMDRQAFIINNLRIEKDIIVPQLRRRFRVGITILVMFFLK
jgi:topoisomerase IV subunit B